MKTLLFGGDEPYAVVSAARSAAIKELSLPELNLIKSDALDAKVVDHLYACPVMDAERVAYVRVEHIDSINNDYFLECQTMEAGRLVVEFKDYDGRSPFFKDMRKRGLVTLCNKENYVSTLPAFLQKNAAKNGVEFAPGALELMLSRVDYKSNESANLFTFLGYLSSLASLDHTITKEMVCSIVPEYHSENVFGITKMILAHDIDGLMMQAEMLSGSSDTIRTLGALLREYRIAYKALYYPMKEIGVPYCSLSKQGKQRIIEGLFLLTSQLDAIKSGTSFGRTLLADTLLRLV